MKKIWHMKVDFDFIHNFGCLKKLKFRLLGLSWTPPRKRTEKVNLKERKRMPVKKIWNLREERPCTMSLRNCEWRRWVGRWERELFFLLLLLLFLVSVRYAFIGWNSWISPIRPVFFLIRNKGVSVPICWSIYTDWYGTGLISLLRISLTLYIWDILKYFEIFNFIF